jgi:hypothetical protein
MRETFGGKEEKSKKVSVHKKGTKVERRKIE